MAQKVKELRLKITYTVATGGPIPEKAYQQLTEAIENGDEVAVSNNCKYPDALVWLVHNINENDCLEWSAEIESID